MKAPWAQSFFISRVQDRVTYLLLQPSWMKSTPYCHTKKILSEFVTALEKLKEAHILYLLFVDDEDCIARCQESFDREVVRKDNFIQWVEEAVWLDAQISPRDSVSRTSSRSTSKSSRRSEHSSRSGSHKSSGTSLSVVRAKEAAIHKKSQFQEEQRFCFKQDEKCLTLETEIAKSKAREDALASMDPNRRLVVPEPTPRSVVPNQTTSEMRVPVQSLPVARGLSLIHIWRCRRS